MASVIPFEELKVGEVYWQEFRYGTALVRVEVLGAMQDDSYCVKLGEDCACFYGLTKTAYYRYWNAEPGSTEREKAPWDMDRAHIVPLEKVLSDCGAGWLENHFEADPAEGEPEAVYLMRCAYCMGNVVTEDGDCTDREYMREHYGKRGGMRIWNGAPAQDQRDNEKWL